MRPLKTVARAILGAAALLACATPGHAEDRPFQGAWRGVGLQSTAQGDIGTWEMRVTFAGGGAQVSYPDLQCSATWTREGGAWREHITAGTCIDRGLVRLHQQDGKLFMTWTVEGETPDIAAAAVLFPTGPIA
jgi:hypothetical protein